MIFGFCFSDEISKRMQSFRNLVKTQDNPFELLISYCVLVDCEVKDEIKKNEALRRQLSVLRMQQLGTAGAEAETGENPGAISGIVDCKNSTDLSSSSSSLSVSAAAAQTEKSVMLKTEAADKSSDLLNGALNATKTTTRKSLSRGTSETNSVLNSNGEEPDQSDPGCSFWAATRVPTGQGEKISGATDEMENQDKVIVPEWLPPILNSGNRKHAVIQAPTTTTILFPSSSVDDVNEDGNSEGMENSFIDIGDISHFDRFDSDSVSSTSTSSSVSVFYLYMFCLFHTTVFFEVLTEERMCIENRIMH